MKKLLHALLLLLILVACAHAARLRVSVPETVNQGQPFFAQIRVNVPVPEMRLMWRGSRYTARPKNGLCRTLLGVPNDEKLAGSTQKLTLEFDWKGQTIQVERDIRVSLKRYPSEKLKVSPKMVTPPASLRSRIERERAAVKKTLALRTHADPLPRTFTPPVKGSPTSLYGKSRSYNGVVKERHGGLDLRAAVGTKVRAPAAGRVVLTGNHYYAGGSVYIDHGMGVITTYFHLSKILVKDGARVKAGDVIALSGATGRVTGPHLHLGLYLSGTPLDPLPLTGRAPFPAETETIYNF